MPGRDGTGPLGEGPSSGRGLGRCARGALPFARRGMGGGLGWCFGYRRMSSTHKQRGPMGIVDPEIYESVAPAQKKAVLEDQIAALEFELSRIRNDLKNIPE